MTHADTLRSQLRRNCYLARAPLENENWMPGLTMTECQAELAHRGWRVEETVTLVSCELVGHHGEASFVLFGASRQVVWQSAVARATHRTT